MDILEQQLYVIKESLISKDGEVVELHPDAEKQITQDLIYINKVKNKEEKERKKAFYDMQKAKTEFQEFISEELGNFYFYFYNKIPKDIGKQYKFRFVYLCCYLKYNDPLNRLVIGNTNGKRFLLEKELKDLLKLKSRDFSYTKKCLIENNLITINHDKTISVNDKCSLRGTLSKGRKKDDFTRIFKNGIIELYNKSLPTEHKKISLLIEILPFINYNHNILCFNPKEPDNNFVKPMKLNNLCEIIGYNPKNAYRLKRELINIRINNEPAILILEHVDVQLIIVNPKVYYKGDNINDLKLLIDYFTYKN